MNITDTRLLDETGRLILGDIMIDIGNQYLIDHSRLSTDDPNDMWLYFLSNMRVIYTLEGSMYYKTLVIRDDTVPGGEYNTSEHITKEQFIDEIQRDHQPIFDWILWNELP